MSGQRIQPEGPWSVREQLNTDVFGGKYVGIYFEYKGHSIWLSCRSPRSRRQTKGAAGVPSRFLATGFRVGTRQRLSLRYPGCLGIESRQPRDARGGCPARVGIHRRLRSLFDVLGDGVLPAVHLSEFHRGSVVVSPTQETPR